jgi:putative holliday junction resolvase
MASHAISQGGLKRHARQDKALVDAVSAVIILQGYMEKRG